MSLTWLSHGSNSVFFSSGPLENTPFEKKYKPLNTPSNSAKEIKVKIIPAQRESRPAHVQTGAEADSQLCDCLAAAMESTGFLDALNSAPVPGIKIKKKKAGATNAKAASPTSTKVLDRLVRCASGSSFSRNAFICWDLRETPEFLVSKSQFSITLSQLPG